VKGPPPRHLKKYVAKCLGLKSYLQRPGEGRTQGRIPAAALLWGLIMGVLLRRAAFAGIEARVRSRARRALDVSPRFGDAALSYFTARLDPEVTRRAAVTAVRQAKRHKAFDPSPFIGLALDGTGAGRSRDKVCDRCRPYRNQQKEIQGYHHKRVMLSVVGTGLRRGETVRVIRYRQYKPNGKVYEAYWLTDFPPPRVSSRTLFLMAKSRWEIENPGFNDAKNRYGFEHICHHQPHRLLVVWLLTCLALTIERLYRVRYLHRGTHPVRAAIDLLLLFQLSLGSLAANLPDSS